MRKAPTLRSNNLPGDCNSIAAGKGDRIRDDLNWESFEKNRARIRGRRKMAGQLVKQAAGRTTYSYA